MLRRIALFAIPLALSSTTAHAIILSTGTLVLSGSLDQTHSCVVTNVGTKPVEVTVEVFDFFGTRLAPDFDQCAEVFSPLPPHASCAVAAPKFKDVSCVIHSPSASIRGLLNVFDADGNIIEAVPATAR